MSAALNPTSTPASSSEIEAFIAAAPSKRSRLARRIGVAQYGLPRSHGLPDELYDVIVDRKLPQPGKETHRDLQRRVYTNLIRAEIAEQMRSRLIRMSLISAGTTLGIIVIGVLSVTGAALFRFGRF